MLGLPGKVFNSVVVVLLERRSVREEPRLHVCVSQRRHGATRSSEIREYDRFRDSNDMGQVLRKVVMTALGQPLVVE